MTNTHHQYCIDVCNSFSHKTCTVAIIPTVILPCDLHILRIIVYLLTATVDTQKSDFHRSITDVDVEISAGSYNSKSVHIRTVPTYLFMCTQILYIVLCVGGSKRFHVSYCPYETNQLHNCIVLYESYAANWANTVHLGKYNTVMRRLYLRNFTKQHTVNR